MRKFLSLFLVFSFVVIYNCLAINSQYISKSSKVYVQGRQLIVEKRLPDGTLDKPIPYVMKGINWAPTAAAPDSGPDPDNPNKLTPYGFFYDWTGHNGGKLLKYWSQTEYQRRYLQDIPILKELGVNTVRVYVDFGKDLQVVNKILDELYANGIMVVMTVSLAKDNFESGDYLEVVKLYKDHPAILVWALGNEWNFNFYYGYTYAQAVSATQQYAQLVKLEDPMHPVSSCLGDNFNQISDVVTKCPSVDLWSINVYRGKSFYNLFSQWESISSQPFFFSEFGIDSFDTVSYTLVNGYQADNCIGNLNENLQADYAVKLWDEIKINLSAKDPEKVCLGGTYFQFNDQLWKVGCYHAGLGGLNDTNYDYSIYDTEGFEICGGFPDDVANEEYFGVVTAEREKKAVFPKLKEVFESF